MGRRGHGARLEPIRARGVREEEVGVRLGLPPAEGAERLRRVLLRHRPRAAEAHRRIPPERLHDRLHRPQPGRAAQHVLPRRGEGVRVRGGHARGVRLARLRPSRRRARPDAQRRAHGALPRAPRGDALRGRAGEAGARPRQRDIPGRVLQLGGRLCRAPLLRVVAGRLGAEALPLVRTPQARPLQAEEGLFVRLPGVAPRRGGRGVAPARTAPQALHLRLQPCVSVVYSSPQSGQR